MRDRRRLRRDGLADLGGQALHRPYLVVWYLGLSNLAAADFTSALSAKPEPAYCLIYICAGAALLGAAVGRERMRATAA